MELKRLFAPDVTLEFLDVLSTLSAVGLTIEEATEIFRECLRDGVFTIIAVIGDRIVGTASLLIERKFIHKGGKVGHIEDVAVHQDFQGQGIGTAMVTHLSTIAHKKGCYKVVLDCDDALIDFYERCGFRRYQRQMRFDCDLG